MLICSSKLDHFPQQIRGAHRKCAEKTTTLQVMFFFLEKQNAPAQIGSRHIKAHVVEFDSKVPFGANILQCSRPYKKGPSLAK